MLSIGRINSLGFGYISRGLAKERVIEKVEEKLKTYMLGISGFPLKLENSDKSSKKSISIGTTYKPHFPTILDFLLSLESRVPVTSTGN